MEVRTMRGDSSTQRQHRREIERKSQRASRQRKKARLEQLERIAAISNSASAASDQSLQQKIVSQQNEISELKETIQKMIALGQEMCNRPSVSGSSEELPLPLPTESKFEEQERDGCFLGQSLDCKQDSNRNFYQEINHLLHIIESNVFNGAIVPNSPTDEDVLLRAVIHGWSAAEGRHTLDLGWQFLRAVDQALLCNIGFVERVAALLLGRTIMISRTVPNADTSVSMPWFLKESETQHLLPYNPVVSYFIWPQLRDELILRQIDNISAAQTLSFFQHVRFVWSFETRDLYMVNRTTDLYCLSSAFKTCFQELHNWRLDPTYKSECVMSTRPFVIDPALPASSVSQPTVS